MRTPLRPWPGFLACCLVGICGCRAFLIEKLGGGIGGGDDLDGIARRILVPWENGTLTWSALFAAHNGDHRIVATRLWEVFWYVVNGSWDPKLVMTAKALIYAAAATTFIHLLAGGLERRKFLAGALLAVLFAFPFGFQNMLWAFQSQFDFFLLATALGWLALIAGRPVLALGSAVAGLFTLGSGPIIAASYVPFFLGALADKKWSLRKTTLLSAAALAIVVWGISLPTQEASPHPGTAMDKLGALARLYAWPHSNVISVVARLPEAAPMFPAALLDFPQTERSWLRQIAGVLRAQPGLVLALNGLMGLIVLAPVLAVAVALVRRRIPRGVAIGPLGVSVFVLLMFVATAIARAESSTIASRYLDYVVLAGFSSIVCALAWVEREPRAWRWLLPWACVLGVGYAITMVISVAQMKRWGSGETRTAILQRYYSTQPTHHAAMTEGDAFRLFIMSRDPTQFMAELDEPEMRRVLPRAVIAPGSAPGAAGRLSCRRRRGVGGVVRAASQPAGGNLLWSRGAHANGERAVISAGRG